MAGSSRCPVLVTGAGGFIGSHLVEALLAEGRRVRALVRYASHGGCGWLAETASASDRLEIIRGDVTDARSVREAVSGCEQVFHLAALIGIPYSYTAPQSYVAVNINGTLNVLEAARDEGVRRVVVTSTSEVYGTVLHADRRSTSAPGAVALLSHQDRRRCPGHELPPSLRAAGHDRAAVQYLRPQAEPAGRDSHDHHSGAVWRRDPRGIVGSGS